MTSREFCYWLQGFFEIDAGRCVDPKLPQALTGDQTEMIKKHLALVFAHEIDPSYPDQEKLNKIHNPPGEVKMRC